jgi:hypothetical protein
MPQRQRPAALKRAARPLRVRGAVVSPLGPVGRHSFSGTYQPALGITHGILQAIP